MYKVKIVYAPGIDKDTGETVPQPWDSKHPELPKNHYQTHDECLNAIKNDSNYQNS